MTQSKVRFPAEWEEQDAVLLAWPHADTDWVDQLDRVRQTYCQVIAAITRFEPVILITHELPETVSQLETLSIDQSKVQLVQFLTNDTWIRDFGPLGVVHSGKPRLLNFSFNGWGEKFRADRDDALNNELLRCGLFRNTQMNQVDLILEGGSIETDGEGSLLTTRRCLLEKNRNPGYSQSELEARLIDTFGLSRVHWLQHGFIEGDDTDGHIDTLARFAPGGRILFQGCDQPRDQHYDELSRMRDELSKLHSLQGEEYELIELPLPQACFDEEGLQMPATYANFLVINGAVLVPTYADPADAIAIERISSAYPGRETIGIDCRSLIRQHGSLHCISMQLIKGVLT